MNGKGHGAGQDGAGKPTPFDVGQATAQASSAATCTGICDDGQAWRRRAAPCLVHAILYIGCDAGHTRVCSGAARLRHACPSLTEASETTEKRFTPYANQNAIH